MLAATLLPGLVLWRQMGRPARRWPALSSAPPQRATVSEPAAEPTVAACAPVTASSLRQPAAAAATEPNGTTDAPGERTVETSAAGPTHSNPTQLRPALLFGAAYALVLLALAWTKQSLGNAGMFTVAGLSGLTEVDALTLSTARMAVDHQTIMADGWRLVLFGTLTNFVSKAAIAAALGGRQFAARVAACFLPPAAIGAALLLWW